MHIFCITKNRLIVKTCFEYSSEHMFWLKNKISNKKNKKTKKKQKKTKKLYLGAC